MPLRWKECFRLKRISCKSITARVNCAAPPPPPPTRPHKVSVVKVIRHEQITLWGHSTRRPIRAHLLANERICGFSISKSVFEFHWSIAVHQKFIRHQFSVLGKDHSSEETSPVFWSGPLRRIHFHFVKYSSLLIQWTTGRLWTMLWCGCLTHTSLPSARRWARTCLPGGRGSSRSSGYSGPTITTPSSSSWAPPSSTTLPSSLGRWSRRTTRVSSTCSGQWSCRWTSLTRRTSGPLKLLSSRSGSTFLPSLIPPGGCWASCVGIRCGTTCLAAEQTDHKWRWDVWRRHLQDLLLTQSSDVWRRQLQDLLLAQSSDVWRRHLQDLLLAQSSDVWRRHLQDLLLAHTYCDTDTKSPVLMAWWQNLCGFVASTPSFFVSKLNLHFWPKLKDVTSYFYFCWGIFCLFTFMSFVIIFLGY